MITNIQKSNIKYTDGYVAPSQSNLSEYALEKLREASNLPRNSVSILAEGLIENKKTFQNAHSLSLPQIFSALQDRKVFQENLNIKSTNVNTTLLLIEITLYLALVDLEPSASQKQLDLKAIIEEKLPDLIDYDIESIKEQQEVLADNQSLLVPLDTIEQAIQNSLQTPISKEDIINQLIGSNNLSFEQVEELSTLLLEDIARPEYKTTFIYIQLAKFNSLSKELAKIDPLSFDHAYVYEACLCVLDSLKSFFDINGYHSFITNLSYFKSTVANPSNGDHLIHQMITTNYASQFLMKHSFKIQENAKLFYEEKILEICSGELDNVHVVYELETLLNLYKTVSPTSQEEVEAVVSDIYSSIQISILNLNSDRISEDSITTFLSRLTVQSTPTSHSTHSSLRLACSPFYEKIQNNYGKLWEVNELDQLRAFESTAALVYSIHNSFKEVPNAQITRWQADQINDLKNTLLIFPTGFLIQNQTIKNAYDQELLDIFFDRVSEPTPIYKSFPEIQFNLSNIIKISVTRETAYDTVTELMHNLNVYYKLSKNKKETIPSARKAANTQLVFWTELKKVSAEKNSKVEEIATKNIEATRRKLQSLGPKPTQEQILFRMDMFKQWLQSALPNYIDYLDEPIVDESPADVRLLDLSPINQEKRVGFNEKNFTVTSFPSYMGKSARMNFLQEVVDPNTPPPKGILRRSKSS